MTTRASIAEIQAAGVTVEPEEAVAIIQQLIDTFCGGVADAGAEAPFGPPTTDTVLLCADGAVVCRSCEATPAVSEVAQLLQQLLPAAPSRIAGGLRYTIARALLDVDVPPFDSLEELSETLARYERGPREAAVARVLQRLDASRALAPRAIADRRRHARATELRRALREADARLYLHKIAAPDPMTITVVPRPARGRTVPAVAACVAAGAMLIGTGELMHQWRTSTAVGTAAAPTPIAAPAPAVAASIAAIPAPADIPSIEPARGATTAAPHAVRVRAASEATPVTSRRDVLRSAKHAQRASRMHVERARARPAASKGVLDRLKLRWLRGVFTNANL